MPERLSRSHREALFPVAIGGRGIEEAARVLDVAQDTIRTKLAAHGRVSPERSASRARSPPASTAWNMPRRGCRRRERRCYAIIRRIVAATSLDL